VRKGSKRSLLAGVLGSARLLDAGGRSRPGRRRLTVLAYHRVCAYNPTSYPLDDELVSALPEAFDAQMRWARAQYDVLSFADLAGACSNGHVPARPLIVTFDDGYRDTYDMALGILERHGISATVFLTTGSINTPELFWFDRIAGWIKRTQVRRLELRDATPFELVTNDDRRSAIRDVQELLKAADEPTHRDLMQQIERQVGTSSLEAPECSRSLTWDEVRDMRTRGIEFGSHTVGHLNLARLSPERLYVELRQSKARIEEETGSQVIALAYPFGTKGTYSNAVRESAQRVGYRFAAAYGGTVNDLATMDAFAVQRIAVERDTSFDLFRGLLRFPWLLRVR
jgi:peptidoglycan/xylan/chitin deacetylase (PgdA/CDA1 family)